jgi:hypothetical protein
MGTDEHRFLRARETGKLNRKGRKEHRDQGMIFGRLGIRLRLASARPGAAANRKELKTAYFDRISSSFVQTTADRHDVQDSLGMRNLKRFSVL